MAIGKIVKWGAIAAFIYSMVYFRGDTARYLKMKRM